MKRFLYSSQVTFCSGGRLRILSAWVSNLVFCNTRKTFLASNLWRSCIYWENFLISWSLSSPIPITLLGNVNNAIAKNAIVILVVFISRLNPILLNRGLMKCLVIITSISNNFATISNNLATILNNFATISNNLATILNNLATILNNLATILNNLAAILNNLATILNNLAAMGCDRH